MKVVKNCRLNIIVMTVKGDHCKHALMEFKIMIKLNIDIPLSTNTWIVQQNLTWDMFECSPSLTNSMAPSWKHAELQASQFHFTTCLYSLLFSQHSSNLLLIIDVLSFFYTKQASIKWSQTYHYFNIEIQTGFGFIKNINKLFKYLKAPFYICKTTLDSFLAWENVRLYKTFFARFHPLPGNINNCHDQFSLTASVFLKYVKCRRI